LAHHSGALAADRLGGLAHIAAQLRIFQRNLGRFLECDRCAGEDALRLGHIVPSSGIIGINAHDAVNDLADATKNSRRDVSLTLNMTMPLHCCSKKCIVMLNTVKHRADLRRGWAAHVHWRDMTGVLYH
ncbi:MAG: hypothetical protein H7Z42_20845, partial [Roseiflexaceae bacterium]|nr:hypothetical protein [Roseiflexaceae bacterium]